MEKEPTTALGVEYSPSGRAGCKAGKSCVKRTNEVDNKGKPSGAVIGKGQLRIKKTAEVEAFGGHVVTSYYHPECFMHSVVPRARSWKLDDVSTIPGFDSIKVEDQTLLKSLHQKPSSAAEGEGEAEGGPKKKARGKKRKAEAEEGGEGAGAGAAATEEEAAAPPAKKRAKKAKKKKAARDEDEDDEE